MKNLQRVLIVFLVLATTNIFAFQKKKRKNRKNNTEQAAPKKKEDKKKTISELVKTSKKIEGLFTIYQDTINGSIQMLVSKEQLKKEFIYFSQIADGVMDAGAFRGSYRGSHVFELNKHFNKIEFVAKNNSYYFDPNNPISKSANANISQGIMAAITIEASDDKKGLYLIKADDLFLKETLSQVKRAKHPKQSPTAFTLGSLDKNKTKINAIRNYPLNTDLAVEYVYSKTSVLNGGSNAVTDARNVSVKVYHSLIAMPENDFVARMDDPRVGYFATQVTDMTSASATPYRDMIHRWNLVKKNPEASVSEPVTPIVWWIENTTPIAFRETITNAVLKWNIAFEKAGFINAVQVKVQPDDAKWDAGDIRYNVLRWTASPNPPFGGYGPSFVNPRTGEIMGADIMLEYVHHTNRVRFDRLFELHNVNTTAFDEETPNESFSYCSLGHLVHENLLFGQTALNTLGLSAEAMEGMKKEAMMHLVMHEVGHTLGLNHNMKSSQLYSPAQLADKKFISGKSLTGSVMDYEAINITNDRSQQGHYFTTTLGPYDEWAIEFGYKNVKNSAELETILKRSTEPQLIFGNDADDMRSPGKAIDPRVMIGDLSNDQITYSINRIKLVKELLGKLKSQYTTEGKSYQELLMAYGILQKQAANASGVISRFIGGVYVERAMQGQANAKQPYTSVEYAKQKKAMNALNKYLFAPNANNTPKELYNYLARQRRGFNFFGGPEDPKLHRNVLKSQRNVLRHLLHYNTLQRVVDSELYGNTYDIGEYLTDLNNGIFKVDIYGSVNTFRQNLQVEYVNMLIDILTGGSKGRYGNVSRSMVLYNIKNIKKMAANGSGNIITKAHKAHLTTLINNALEEVK
ncbi:MAG: hypothetical protein COA88_07935 [Kordia sp.]|nr:MAG: hypothetical protein COA88_07935 [Kordia sp.]